MKLALGGNVCAFAFGSAQVDKPHEFDKIKFSKESRIE